MPTRNVSLTEELDSFVNERIQSGDYDNASEVIRAALRALRQVELEDEAKVKALRVAIKEGLDSGIYEGDVIAEMHELIVRRSEKNARKEKLSA